MNVYVAGAYCDKPTAQQVQDELKTLGCVITHDWTRLSSGHALEDALADARGVKQADVVVPVFSVTQHAYRGTFTEMGMALGLCKPVVALCLVDGDYRHNPFLQLPQVRMAHSLDELLCIMKSLKPGPSLTELVIESSIRGSQVAMSHDEHEQMTEIIKAGPDYFFESEGSASTEEESAYVK